MSFWKLIKKFKCEMSRKVHNSSFGYAKFVWKRGWDDFFKNLPLYLIIERDKLWLNSVVPQRYNWIKDTDFNFESIFFQIMSGSALSLLWYG